MTFRRSSPIWKRISRVLQNSVPTELCRHSPGGRLRLDLYSHWSRGLVLNYFGTLRARLGWLVMPTLLVRHQGGFAYGGGKLSMAFVALWSGG
jgi:hypothetical protein